MFNSYKIKILSLFICGFSLFIFSCSRPADYLYEVIDMKAGNADNSGNTASVSSATAWPAKSYAIHLKYTMQLVPTNDTYPDPNESGYKNVNTLQSFNVYSLNNFDAQHPAGTHLNDYFLVSNGSFYNSKNTLANTISTNSYGGGRSSYKNTDEIWDNNQYLILMRAPSALGNYTFVVEMQQSNGRNFKDSTIIELY